MSPTNRVRIALTLTTVLCVVILIVIGAFTWAMTSYPVQPLPQGALPEGVTHVSELVVAVEGTLITLTWGARPTDLFMLGWMLLFAFGSLPGAIVFLAGFSKDEHPLAVLFFAGLLTWIGLGVSTWMPVSSEALIDPVEGQVTVHRARAAGLWRTELELPFDEIESVGVGMTSGVYGPMKYAMELNMRSGERAWFAHFRGSSSNSKAVACQLRDAVASAMGVDTVPPEVRYKPYDL